jgi:non-specific protein-tyrosine kinase
MRSLLAQLREEADMLIIDTPPLLAVSDAIPLQEQASGTVLVARIDHTNRDGVRKATSLISTAGGNLLGFVATGIQLGGVGGAQAYGYGDGYASESSTNGASPNGHGPRLPFGRRARSGSGKSA